MSDFLDGPFRSAHGFNRLNVLARDWNGINFRYLEMSGEGGPIYGDISSEKTNLAISLDQHGGYAEPRFKLDQPTPRMRYDAGFAVWVPRMHTIWGWSEKVSLVRELRLTFDVEDLAVILEDEFDAALAKDPLILLYDSRVTQCARVLAGACIDPRPGDRLFIEGMTTALFASLFSAWRKKSPLMSGSGLASWQLRRATDYIQAHFMRT